MYSSLPRSPVWIAIFGVLEGQAVGVLRQTVDVFDVHEGEVQPDGGVAVGPGVCVTLEGLIFSSFALTPLLGLLKHHLPIGVAHNQDLTRPQKLQFERVKVDLGTISAFAHADVNHITALFDSFPPER